MEDEKRKLWKSKYNKEYRIKNLEKIKFRQRKLRLENPEKYREKEKARDPEKEKLRRKIYNKNNRPKINEYVRNRYQNDTQYRLTCVLRNRLYSTTRYKRKAGSAVKDLGCTLGEFKIYLESKFLKGMSWDNWTYKGWHIDHIIPLSSFDLTKEEEFKKAVHYTNLQPMWSMDNHRKSNKII